MTSGPKRHPACASPVATTLHGGARRNDKVARDLRCNLLQGWNESKAADSAPASIPWDLKLLCEETRR